MQPTFGTRYQLPAPWAGRFSDGQPHREDNVLNLILTVIGLTAFVHLMKYAQAKGHRVYAVAAVNYVIAALISLAFWFHYAPMQLPVVPVILGALVGAGYVATYVLLDLGIAGSGVSLTSTVSRLSIVIPILASLYWDRVPNALQIAGIALIMISLPLIGTEPSANPTALKKPSFRVLALLFVTGGLWQVIMKIIGETRSPGPVFAYILALFATAAVVSTFIAVWRKQPPRLGEIAAGAMIGGSNVLSNLPILLALETQPGAVVFSTRTSAAVVLTILLSMVLWGERLSKRSFVGVGTAVVALVLVNVRVTGGE